MAYPEWVSATERRIITRIIRKALKVGYSVSVYDGQAWALSKSTDFEAITAEVHATDLTQLRFRLSGGAIVGSVILIHGNDEDVVHDMTDNEAMAFLTDDRVPE